MTTALDIIRYHSGIAGEEVADMVDSLEQEASSLREQVEKLTKERDEYMSGFEAAASKYRNLKSQMQEIINVC